MLLAGNIFEVSNDINDKMAYLNFTLQMLTKQENKSFPFVTKHFYWPLPNSFEHLHSINLTLLTAHLTDFWKPSPD